MLSDLITYKCLINNEKIMLSQYFKILSNTFRDEQSKITDKSQSFDIKTVAVLLTVTLSLIFINYLGNWAFFYNQIYNTYFLEKIPNFFADISLFHLTYWLLY